MAGGKAKSRARCEEWSNSMLNAIKRAVATAPPSTPDGIDHTLDNVFRYTRLAASFGRDIIGRESVVDTAGEDRPRRKR